jgi:hypothetical protein
LERTSLSVEQVAAEVGFRSASVFREHFGGILGTTPLGCRRAFGPPGVNNRRRKSEPDTLVFMAVLQFPRSRPGLGSAGRNLEIGSRGNMQVILERVKIDLDEDEIRRLIDAVDHYEAYLHSQQRDEAKFRELLVRLRKVLGKPRTRGSE